MSQWMDRKGAGLGIGMGLRGTIRTRVPAGSAVPDTAVVSISCAFLFTIQPLISSAAAVKELRICS